MNKRRIITGIIIFLFYQVSYTQIEKEEQTIVQLIASLEQQFNCRFSYADTALEGITIKNLPSYNKLKDYVLFLEENTELKFTFISEDQIAIRAADSKYSICGYLFDLDTEESVQNASVQVEGKVYFSDELGYFQIDEIEQVSSYVFITRIGYKPQRLQVLNFVMNKCNKHLMIPKIEQIREITIRNFLTKGIRRTIDGNFDINYKNFGILPGLIEPDVLQTIQSLPGIQSVDEKVSNINIRGGSHYENLILWDGIKMYQSGHFFGLISAFNPLLTKKVRLIKNGTDPQYSDGVSGTIAMFTDDHLDTEKKAAIGMNLINLDLFLALPLSTKSSIQIAGRKSINEWVQTPSFDQYFDKAFQNTELVNGGNTNLNSNEEFSFFDFNLRWLYQISPKEKLKFNALIFNNELVFLENAETNTISTSKESNISQKNIATGFHYERLWSDRLSTEVNAYLTSYVLNSTNSDILNEQRLKQENEVIEESLGVLAKYKVNDALFLNTSYQFVETGVRNIQDVDNPLFRSDIKNVIRSHGLGTQLEYLSYAKSTRIKAGLRLNYIEKFDEFLVEPRLVISHQIFDRLSVELLGEFKHQNTTQIIDFQTDFLGVENRRWLLVNNDDIPIVQGKQISLGLHYDVDNFLFSVESYLRDVDGIASQSQGFQNQFQFEKAIGSSDIFGFDVLLNHRRGAMSTWLTYSFENNDSYFPELNKDKFPSNFDITHSVTLGASYTKNSLKVSTGFNWHTGKPTTGLNSLVNLVNGEIDYGAPNSERLEDYLRLDFSLQYDISLAKKSNIHLGLSVWNVLNASNISNRYYRLVEDQVEVVEQKSLGLTPNLSIRYFF